MKNKIGWCNLTFNPAWGCLNNCEYCYARKMAKRFAGKMNILEIRYKSKNRIDKGNYFIQEYIKLSNFKPTFLYSQFGKKFPKKPQRIFVGSMSEIYYWNEEWIERVIEKVKKYPQHAFQFLTKYPRVYYEWAFPPENCWLGITVTGKENKNDMQRIYEFSEDNANLEYHNIKYISFEPLLDWISPVFMTGIDWVIIGFQTNPFKKIEKESITNIIEFTRKNDIPLFLKDSINKGYPDLPIIKEFPDGR